MSSLRLWTTSSRGGTGSSATLSWEGKETLRKHLTHVVDTVGVGTDD